MKRKTECLFAIALDHNLQKNNTLIVKAKQTIRI